MYKINTKTLPNWFGDFLQISSEMHYYLTRFATGNNYSYFCSNKPNSQRSIRYERPTVSFRMSYQMNLKTMLIQADKPS